MECKEQKDEGSECREQEDEGMEVPGTVGWRIGVQGTGG
jgi:hypothetical protein